LRAGALASLSRRRAKAGAGDTTELGSGELLCQGLIFASPTQRPASAKARLLETVKTKMWTRMPERKGRLWPPRTRSRAAALRYGHSLFHQIRRILRPITDRGLAPGVGG
jgi:hypothetical protein